MNMGAEDATNCALLSRDHLVHGPAVPRRARALMKLGEDEALVAMARLAGRRLPFVTRPPSQARPRSATRRLAVDLREASIQPLDVILFRGVDPVSHAICFIEAKKLGRGDFSHVGLAITREVLDLPFLEPGKVYVWESTLSAPAGFWGRFTDKVPDAETAGVRFGVQIRDLELVVPGYSSNGGKVAWCAFHGPRPPIEVVRQHLHALHEEFGHAPYTRNLLALFSVVYPALRTDRDRFDRAEDRLAHFRNHVLHRAREHKTAEDAEHHVFCSEWVGTVYKRLGLSTPEFDPYLAAPVTPLLSPNLFAEPVVLEHRDDAAEPS